MRYVPYFTTSGDPLSTEFPYGEITFDWFSRPVVVEGPNSSGGVSEIEYEYSGLTTIVTDPDGYEKTYIKDYLGRIVSVQEDSSGGTTYYTYNAAGDLTQVEDADSNTTTINYDTLGRKINMTDPDMGYWQYTYDANGNLLTQTDAKNQIITFVYDELNRVESKTYSTSDPTVTFTYDDLSIDNGIGMLYSVTNGDVTTVINGYDEMGRGTSVSKTISGTSRTTAFEYDLSGKTTKTTYPGGYYVTNEYYSGTNLLHTVTGSDSEVYATISDYEPTGKVGTITHGNGTFTTYSYDDGSTRLMGILTKDASNNTIQDRSYAYSSAGDIESIYDDIDDVTYTYTYDDLHRLKTETNDGGYGNMSVNYDELGNITSKTVGSTTLSYVYNNTDHIHAVSAINGYSFSYDDNGNMTQGWDFTDPSNIKQRDFEWNADNMPVEISYGGGEATTTLLYDGIGSRARKEAVSGGATTYTYYFGDHYEVKEAGGTETVIKYIFAGNLRVAQIEDSSVSYFHKDHLGSSTLMTDASGAQIESTNYEPFGGVRDHTGTDTSNYDFTDQELDAENGLYNYGARLYDPIIGRFISPDTIVSAPYNPQSLNRYSYCLNNPLIYVDPSGHEDEFILDPITIIGEGGWTTWYEDPPYYWCGYKVIDTVYFYGGYTETLQWEECKDEGAGWYTSKSWTEEITSYYWWYNPSAPSGGGGSGGSNGTGGSSDTSVGNQEVISDSGGQAPADPPIILTPLYEVDKLSNDYANTMNSLNNIQIAMEFNVITDTKFVDKIKDAKDAVWNLPDSALQRGLINALDASQKPAEVIDSMTHHEILERVPGTLSIKPITDGLEVNGVQFQYKLKFKDLD